MNLYVIRHAIAEERHIFAQTGQPDEFRPITARGAERMRKILALLKKNEDEMDTVLQSPLVRCQETGDLVREYYPNANYLNTDRLRPNLSADKLYREIQSFGGDSMAIIGHEPDLGQFISWLLFGQASERFPIKKGGIAKLNLYKNGRCYLKWLLKPKLILDYQTRPLKTPS